MEEEGESPKEGTGEKRYAAKPNVASAVCRIIFGNPVLALGLSLTPLDSVAGR